ncbi:hypothetical protein C8R44DRAFT_603596 [Mycena epipterygia]|nr:hypothetical protein C8R44DRAFT_603596 [Mycena epipterygia]
MVVGLTITHPRKHAALLFQLCSQHIPLTKHLHRLNKLPSSTCPCCDGADETINHFLHFCPAHAAACRALHSVSRIAHYSKHLLTDPGLLPDLFQYIQRTGRFHAVYRDFKELERPETDA